MERNTMFVSFILIRCIHSGRTQLQTVSPGMTPRRPGYKVGRWITGYFLEHWGNITELFSTRIPESQLPPVPPRFEGRFSVALRRRVLPTVARTPIPR